MVDQESRLGGEYARKLLSELLNKAPNCFSYGMHFKDRMTERQMTIGDVLNVLHTGKILRDAEFEE